MVVLDDCRRRKLFLFRCQCFVQRILDVEGLAAVITASKNPLKLSGYRLESKNT